MSGGRLRGRVAPLVDADRLCAGGGHIAPRVRPVDLGGATSALRGLRPAIDRSRAERLRVQARPSLRPCNLGDTATRCPMHVTHA
jgi:hypothetical protein